MESQYSYGSISSREGRPLPPLPASESGTSGSSNVDLSRSTTQSFRPRISMREYSPSVEEERPEPQIHFKESVLTPSISEPNLIQSSRMFLDDSSNVPINSYSTNNTRASSNSNVSQQNTDSRSNRRRVSAYTRDSRPRVRTLPLISQYPGEVAGSRTQSDTSRNSHYISHISPRLSLAPVSINQIEPREIALQRWQLDSEASFCPICKSQFSFFLRKHHCRKCGRVVCNSCSPHRITIPNQYVVQPVSQAETSASQILRILQSDLYGSSENTGGRQVRLCNPCVRDPSTTHSHTATSASDQFGQNFNYSYDQSNIMRSRETPLRIIMCGQRESADPVTVDSSVHSRQQITVRNRANSARASESSHRSGYTRRREQGSSSGSFIGPFIQANHDNSSSLPSDAPGFQCLHSLHRSSQREQSHSQLQAPRNLQVSEEDECWVCHQELPSKDIDNYEVLRAAHVNSCINIAIRLASGPRDNENTALMLATRNESENRSLNVAGISENSVLTGNSQLNNHGASSKMKRTRRTGIFSYNATEKDCIDNAECIICLEEFEVGIEMGRLECFCRFHLKCIREWFETKSGLCPIHQSGLYH